MVNRNSRRSLAAYGGRDAAAPGSVSLTGYWGASPPAARRASSAAAPSSTRSLSLSLKAAQVDNTATLTSSSARSSSVGLGTARGVDSVTLSSPMPSSRSSPSKQRRSSKSKTQHLPPLNAMRARRGAGREGFTTWGVASTSSNASTSDPWSPSHPSPRPESFPDESPAISPPSRLGSTGGMWVARGYLRDETPAMGPVSRPCSRAGVTFADGLIDDTPTIAPHSRPCSRAGVTFADGLIDDTPTIAPHSRPCSRGGVALAAGARPKPAATVAHLPSVSNPGSLGTGPCFAQPKGIWVMNAGEKVYDLFTWDRVLQESEESKEGNKVVICRVKPGAAEDSRLASLSGDCQYVLKMRLKSSFGMSSDEARFRRTLVTMLNIPSHPCVTPTYEVLEDGKHYYIVSQLASNGTFFDSLLRDFPTGVIPSSTVKVSIRNVLLAAGHLHGHGLLHRDIKPDNLVVHREKETRVKRVMLVDFDQAVQYTPLEKHAPIYGTLRFNAPETFEGAYSPQSDIYSLGVTLYLLMTGKVPYDDTVYWTPFAEERTNREIYASMKSKPIDWDCSPWPQLPVCKDFCQQLLAFNPAMRLQSCEHALQHRWFESDWEDSDLV